MDMMMEMGDELFCDGFLARGKGWLVLRFKLISMIITGRLLGLKPASSFLITSIISFICYLSMSFYPSSLNCHSMSFENSIYS